MLLQLLTHIRRHWRSSKNANIWPTLHISFWKCVDRKGWDRHQNSLPETVVRGIIILPVPVQKSFPGVPARDQRGKAPFIADFNIYFKSLPAIWSERTSSGNRVHAVFPKVFLLPFRMSLYSASSWIGPNIPWQKQHHLWHQVCGLPVLHVF